MQKIPLYLFFYMVVLQSVCAQQQFWGTASQGGLYGNGFIFKTDSIGDNLVIVHHFQKAVDGNNISALTLASNNKLYGVASDGGQSGAGVFASGTLFEYDLATDQFRVLEHFGPGNTKLPLGVTTPRAEGQPNIYEVSPGVLWILMYQGRYVYAYDLATGVFTKPFTIPSYQGGATNGTLQNTLNRTFIKASNGMLYASTQTNSSCPIPNPYMGSIVRVNPSNNAFTIVHKAACLVEFGFTYDGFLLEKNGKLYSTTQYGGANNKGVIYEFDLATNVFSKRHDFAGSVYNYAATALTFADNGKLYGVAHGGGIPEPNLSLESGGGVLFEFDLATNIFSKKHDFTLTGQSIFDMGIFPSSLVTGTNGKLYGATQYGVFEYNTTTEEIRVAGRFVDLGFAPSLLELCRKPAYVLPVTSSNVICDGAEFSIDLASSNTTSVVWKHDDVVDETQTGTVLQFEAFTMAQTGTWVATLSNECGATTTQPFTFSLGTPDQPVIMAEGETNFCEGESVTLSAPEGFVAYTWSNGETTQEISVLESGDYTVKVNDGCESLPSEPVSVVMNPLPAAPTAITQFGDVLTAIGGSGNYLWTFNDEPLNDHDAQLEVSETGQYKAYSLSDQNCISFDFAAIDFVVTGLESAVGDLVEMYPNPVHGELFVKVKQVDGEAVVTIIDVTGIKLMERQITMVGTPVKLDLTNLPAGLYNVMVKTGSNVDLKRINVR